MIDTLNEHNITPKQSGGQPKRGKRITILGIGAIVISAIGGFFLCGALEYFGGKSNTESVATTTSVMATNTGSTDTPDRVRPPEQKPSLPLLSDGCDYDTCIVQGPAKPVGYGWVSGYYETRTRPPGGMLGASTSTCNAFHVNDGNQVFLNHFRKLVERGNSINAFTPGGDLLLNISLSSVADNSRTIIKQSSSENQIRLQLFQKELKPVGAGACYSFFEIIDVVKQSPPGRG